MKIPLYSAIIKGKELIDKGYSYEDVIKILINNYEFSANALYSLKSQLKIYYESKQKQNNESVENQITQNQNMAIQNMQNINLNNDVLSMDNTDVNDILNTDGGNGINHVRILLYQIALDFAKTLMDNKIFSNIEDLKNFMAKTYVYMLLNQGQRLNLENELKKEYGGGI